jgi:hypothetical protein
MKRLLTVPFHGCPKSDQIYASEASTTSATFKLTGDTDLPTVQMGCVEIALIPPTKGFKPLYNNSYIFYQNIRDLN